MLHLVFTCLTERPCPDIWLSIRFSTGDCRSTYWQCYIGGYGSRQGIGFNPCYLCVVSKVHTVPYVSVESKVFICLSTGIGNDDASLVLGIIYWINK